MNASDYVFQYYFDDVVGTFLGHSEHLAHAALSLDVPQFGLARSLLLGQSVELSLKAWILAKRLSPGIDAKEAVSCVRIQFGHDLRELWNAAIADGLALDVTPPRWFEFLAVTHDRPYQLRYPTTATAFRVLDDDSCNLVIALCERVAASLHRAKRNA